MVVSTYDNTLYITTFVGGGGISLGIIGVFGLISAVSTFCLLFYLLVPPFRQPSFSAEVSRGVSDFIRDPLGWLLVQVLLSDFLQGCGFVTNLHWASSSTIWAGSACSFQSAITEIGDVGGALFSAEISIYTFLVLFVRCTPPPWTSILSIFLSWILLIVLSAIGPLALQTAAKGPFYDSSGAWCWIGQGYQVERFFFLYFFIFLSVALSWICYSMLFVRASTIMSNKASREEAFRSSQGGKVQAPVEVKDELGEKINAMSRRMLWYPLLYSIVVVPVSICRLSVMAHNAVPLDFFIFAGILFSSSGTVNVILFFITRQSFIVRQARRAITYTRTKTITVSPAAEPLDTSKNRPRTSKSDSFYTFENALDQIPFEDGYDVAMSPLRSNQDRGQRRGSWDGSVHSGHMESHEPGGYDTEDDGSKVELVVRRA